MSSIGEASAADHLAKLRAQGVDTLVIGAADVNGIFRAKRFSLELLCREDVSIAISEYVFATDLHDAMIRPGPDYRGYFPTESLGLPDLYIRPDWTRASVLPWDTRTAVVVGDYYTHGGDEVAVSPRGILKRVIRRLASMGVHPMAGCEFEFFILRGRPDEIRESGAALVPLSSGPSYHYGRGASDERLIGTVRRNLEKAGIPVEAANPEAAPGQSEITIRYANALAAADFAFLYKQFVSELLEKEGMTSTFIAKLAKNGYGSSGHIHISLQDSDGKSLMVDDTGAVSDLAHFSVGGFLETLPSFTALYAPNINSYRRYQTPYGLAGDAIAWGLDNRTCAVRFIHEGASGTRFESRTPGADMNPYLALAAALAGVGYGIEQEVTPPAQVVGDAYREPAVQRVPNSLDKATALLKDSAVAKDWLGDEFVNFYAETRVWESEQHRAAITDWELQRYL